MKDNSPKKHHGVSYFLARIALGTLFIVAGVDGFLQIVPFRAFTSEGESVLRGIQEQKPLWIVINTLQIIAGSILFFGIFDVLAIFLLAPIVIGIIGFHFMFDQAGIPFALFIAFLLLFLGWNMLEDPKSLFKLNFDDGIRNIWRRPHRLKRKHLPH